MHDPLWNQKKSDENAKQRNASENCDENNYLVKVQQNYIIIL